LDETAWCLEPPKELDVPGLPPEYTDEPLSESVWKEIQDSIERARTELKLDAANTTPETAQQAIYDKLRELAAGGRLKPEARQDYAIALGCLWGQAVCDALGWEWCAVKKGDAKVFSVASPNRSHHVPPMQFLQNQLRRRGADAEITSLLLFNMLKAGDLPPAKAHELQALG
jgi:hypothetical protein